MWIEGIRLKNLSTLEESNLMCGGVFEAQAQVTTFDYNYQYNSLTVDYAQVSVENMEFTPLSFQFTAHTNKEQMSEFKKTLRRENSKFELIFKYNDIEYNVFCVISSENISSPYNNGHLEEHTLNLTTETHFLEIEDFPFEFADGGNEHTGDVLPAQLPFKLDQSVRNSLNEAKVEFTTKGDLKSFIRVEMEGPKTEDTIYNDPKFGLNTQYDNTIDSFDIQNTPMIVGDILIVDSFPYRRTVTKNGVNLESNCNFLGHRTFINVGVGRTSNIMYFKNVISGNIKVYNQYRLPR